MHASGSHAQVIQVPLQRQPLQHPVSPLIQLCGLTFPVGLCYTPNIQIHTPGLNFSFLPVTLPHLLLALSTLSSIHSPWLADHSLGKGTASESPVCL